MKTLSLILLFAALSAGHLRAVVIAQNAITRMVIAVDPAATPTENFAARQLAGTLSAITGATIQIQTNSKAPSRAILVGPGAAARKAFKDAPFDELGGEELIMRTRGNHLLLAGGSPRGTLYAVSRFLQEQAGVRWWTPWAGAIPRRAKVEVKNLNVREKPAFEYREPFWFMANNPDWAWRNTCNGNASGIPQDEGGHISYKGFVHTFYPLVPPEKYFSVHPEWFSLVKGKRVGTNAQLCLTNPKLREFFLEQVKQELRQSPETSIVSVSQNDCKGACECPNCAALDDAEGSHSGTMIDFANYIADNIKAEFPNVAVDTLAYQYTRKPPRTLRPRPNLIVRLCSIECNFGAPLDDPSNASFADDIRGWSERADRLYIWDYVTDFAHFVEPYPNWFVLGPNLRFFQAHHVRGVFEEGAYQSPGAEMAEMRSWVLAQLLWNPQQDDRALIREFLDGYYGTAAGPIIWRYMEMLHEASGNYYLRCFTRPNPPYLQFAPMAKAEALWQDAERAVAGNEELLDRVRLGHLPVLYSWLKQWDQLQKECAAAGMKWPLKDSRNELASRWRAMAGGIPGKPWTKITCLSENGETPEKFLSQFQ
jgi:hypothetical protein